MSTSPAPTILVDGSSYLFRAFHALPPLTNSKGNPTGAIKGVINMMRSLQRQYPASKIVVIFDAKGKTFRNDMYSEYKANRPPMPDDLRVQIEPIHNIIKAMGFPFVMVDGVEADDVIGTYAVEATATGQETIISTGDKDMAQLVTKHVTLMNTMTNTYMDIEGVKEKFGIPPELIIDYLALCGDKVDNIPGVDKCGPKTAVKWLLAYGSMQGVIAEAPNMKGKIGEHLRNAVDHLPLSYDLATIKCDLELDQKLAEIQHNPVDKDALLAIYQECEFKTWVKDLDSNAATSAPASNTTDSSLSASGDAGGAETFVATERLDPMYETVLTQDRLDWWLDRLQQFELFAFDTETTSLNYMQAEIVGVSFAVENNKAAYVPLAHDYLGAPEQLSRDAVLAQMKPLLENADRLKVGQNLKYDKHVLANYDIDLQGIAHDTMLASYSLNSVASRHNMDALAKHYLDVETIHFEDIAGKGAKQKKFNELDLEQAAPYAAEDADITLRLHRALWGQLQGTDSLKRIYQDYEVPLLNVLAKIERNGVKVDAAMLAQQSHELEDGMRQAEEAAHTVAGKAFNLGSPKQLQVILFEEQDIPVIRKTPKGQPSTAEDVLQELADEGHELPGLILKYRGLSKLKSTYTDKLPLLMDNKTGRVHTSYQQAVAATGRLSSTDPNLQNIPVRNAEGRRIRQAFVPEEGNIMVAADYSQIELRIMAHLSGDESLLKAFTDGVDVHQATAAEVFGVPVDEVEKEQRRRAKAVNFGLIYGMSAFGLAKQLGISRKEAQSYVDIYFQRYPGVQEYMENTRERAKEQGYVETEFGRRLYLPDISSKNGMRRQHAERTAINAPMQGTAADIIKRAMIDLDASLAKDFPEVCMIMQVHDELVFEVPRDQLKAASTHIRMQMEQAAELKVPLVVDVGVGENWDEAH